MPPAAELAPIDLAHRAEIRLLVEGAGIISDRIGVQRDLPQIAERADEWPRPVQREVGASRIGAVGAHHVERSGIEAETATPRDPADQNSCIGTAAGREAVCWRPRLIQCLVELDVEPGIGALAKSLGVDLAGQQRGVAAKLSSADAEITT